MLRLLLKPLFSWLEFAVYPHVLPNYSFRGGYLIGIYDTAGLKVALTQSLMIFAVWSIALVRFRKPVGRLSEQQLQSLFQRLMTSERYHFRLLGYAVKSHALVAAYGTYADEAAKQPSLESMELTNEV